MQDIPALAEQLEREKLQHARDMSPADRFWSSLELTDQMRSIALCSIRNRFPDASEDEVAAKYWERIEIARRLDALR